MKYDYVNNFNDLIIPNKLKWETFYEKFKKNYNNVALIGPNDSCKTTIIKLIINDFLKLHSEYKKALDLAKLILHKDPNNGFIYQIIGKIYFSLGEMRNAILNFDKAIRLDPSCDQNYNFIEKKAKV